MKKSKKTPLKQVFAVMLSLALIFTSMGISSYKSPVYADSESASVDVSIRIEDATETYLPHIPLTVERFNIAPYITGDSSSFIEPSAILSAHALIEAIYFKHYNTDPSLADLASQEAIDTIKNDLVMNQTNWGLSIGSIHNNSFLVSSTINNICGGGIGSDALLTGDSIVFYPWKNSNETSISNSYSYFVADQFSYDTGNDKMNLKLYNLAYDANWKPISMPTSGAAITAKNTSTTISAITNKEGSAELTLTPGEYTLSATNAENTLVTPYAKVTIQEDSYTILEPAQNLALTELKLSNVDVLSHINSHFTYTLSNAIDSIRVSAITVPSSSAISMTFIDPSGTSSAITKDNDFSISEGTSYLNIIVTNPLNQKKAYRLPIKRRTATEDKDITITTTLDAISSRNDLINSSDWVIGQFAYKKELSADQKNTYLTKVLFDSRKDIININDIAKDIIALANMGIDPCAVPDAYGNPINLVKLVYDSTPDVGPYGIYTAPYMLLALNSNDYEIPSDSNWTKEKLKNYILNEQNQETGAWGGEYATAGDAASILLALSPYQSESAVNSATIKSLQYISENQEINGTFNGANYTSYTVLLASLFGLDADSDAHFISDNDKSAIDGLLSYQISSGSNQNMFAYQGNENYNVQATADAYRALISYNNLKDGNNANLFSLNKDLIALPKENWPSNANPLTGIRIVTPPTKTTYVAGDTLRLDGMKVEAIYADGTATILNASDGTSGYQLNLACGETIDTPLTTGTYTKTISYQGKTANFIIEVKSKESDQSQLKEISVAVKNNKNAYILRKTDVEIIPGKTTAIDVLKIALDKNEIPYFIQSGCYIANIDGLGEFDKGENSGWLYSVNRTTPSTTAASDYELQDGDVVLFYYTKDYTKDSSSSNWTKKEEISTIEVEVDKSGNATASISEEEFNKLVKDKKDLLKITTDIATLTFDKNAMKEISEKATGDIKIVVSKVKTSKLSKEMKKKIGDRPVYDFNVTSEKKTISNFNGTVTIKIPYTPASTEDLNALVIYYVNKDNNLEIMKNCNYDKSKKQIIFTTNHFSKYVIGYNPVEFNDTKGHWSEANIHYLASRGIIKGKSPNEFKPNDKITRAEFITILSNKLNADFSNYTASSFNDVCNTDWFSNAVNWGSSNKIINGYNGKFRPNDNITRQEMAVVLDRFITQFEQTTTLNKKKAVAFSDDTQIASYAKESVTKIQQLGLINGKGANTFAPTDNATRAEVATIITSLMKTSL